VTSHVAQGIFTESRREDLEGGPIMRSYATGMSEASYTPRTDDEILDSPNSGLALATILFVAPILTIAGLIWLMH
jgi:hypothetical protein